MQAVVPAEQHAEVWRIRNMLYEFRNVTLDSMLHDRPILFLITFYLMKNKMDRIKLKRTLLRNKNAYLIAISQIYDKSQISQIILGGLGTDKDSFLEMVFASERGDDGGEEQTLEEEEDESKGSNEDF